MATWLSNLSEYDPDEVPDGRGFRVGIVVAEWNGEITKALCDASVETLIKHGVAQEDIIIQPVPGTIELTAGAKLLASQMAFQSIICIGCVIKGDTPHFDYVCQSATYGITQLNLEKSIPFIFGVLTTNTLQQAFDRAGGKHGNKGDEAAITALKMMSMSVF